MSVRLGELLIRATLITQDQLKEALKVQKETGTKLGETLIKLGFVSEEDITECLSQQFGVPSINLAHFEIDGSVIKLIPADVARKYNILPVNKTGATITIAMADPTNVFAMDDIKFMTGYNVEPVVASELGIKAAIENYYGSTAALELKKVMEDLQAAESDDLEVLEEEEDLDIESLAAESEEAPVVKLVNLILTDAITSRVKILSKLDISEKRLPQDGRIKMKMKLNEKTKELDFRVSVLPTLFGEKIVLRLLDKDNLRLDMTKLGFEQESLTKFEEAIFKPWGMVLVTGPTGSGKTNTLYSALSKVNSPEVNIMTAEDPVEFNLPGINQVQMKEQIGLNFATTLRSFLRQDPNIVLVGEIRDFETAEIAIKAALTGHLVLSTLHTNDAPSTVNRLMNMGIEPFLVATSVLLIAAQRLVRRVCSGCKEEVDINQQALMNLGYRKEEIGTFSVYKGRGCDKCGNTGYKGRVGLIEVMAIDDEIRELILAGASALELRRKAMDNGMISLRRSGLVKIKEGITTIEEVVRETVL
ncbi:MAG: ATPase, T2SS/T4P/T4SS family [Thermoanaerobaculia bacterium]